MRRRRFLKPIVISLVVHVVLIGALLGWGLSRWEVSSTGEPAEDADRPAETARADPESSEPEPSASETETENRSGLSSQQVAQRINRGIAQASEQSDRQKLRSLEKQARRLRQISDPESLDSIGRLVRSGVETRDRAYQPAADPPPGPFDHDSALIWTVESAGKKESGSNGLVYVLVDKAGRTQRIPVPDGGEAAAKAVQRVQRSPLLRKLYRRMVLPVLDAKMRQREGSDPPPAGR